MVFGGKVVTLGKVAVDTEGPDAAADIATERMFRPRATEMGAGTSVPIDMKIRQVGSPGETRRVRL